MSRPSWVRAEGAQALAPKVRALRSSQRLMWGKKEAKVLRLLSPAEGQGVFQDQMATALAGRPWAWGGDDRTTGLDYEACAVIRRGSREFQACVLHIYGGPYPGDHPEVVVMTDGTDEELKPSKWEALGAQVCLEVLAARLEAGEVPQGSRHCSHVLHPVVKADASPLAAAIAGLAAGPKRRRPGLSQDSESVRNMAGLLTIQGEHLEAAGDFEGAAVAYRRACDECGPLIPAITPRPGRGAETDLQAAWLARISEPDTTGQLKTSETREGLWNNLGLALKRAGRFAEADCAYLKALEGAHPEDYCSVHMCSRNNRVTLLRRWKEASGGRKQKRLQKEEDEAMWDLAGGSLDAHHRLLKGGPEFDGVRVVCFIIPTALCDNYGFTYAVDGPGPRPLLTVNPAAIEFGHPTFFELTTVEGTLESAIAGVINAPEAKRPPGMSALGSSAGEARYVARKTAGLAACQPDNVCDACGVWEDGASYRKCSACKAAWYCSRDCQKAAWRGGHKRECPDLVKAEALAMEAAEKFLAKNQPEGERASVVMKISRDEGGNVERRITLGSGATLLPMAGEGGAVVRLEVSGAVGRPEEMRGMPGGAKAGMNFDLDLAREGAVDNVIEALQHFMTQA